MTVHAYFAEKETLLEVFDAWPDQMGAIVLLEEGDGHHISLYHQEEADRVLTRLSRRLGLPREALILVSPEGVGPPADGHPRVRIRFSEDREILELIGHHKDLPERARDYRINFEYVRDQGLGTGLDADLNPITPEGEGPLVFAPIPRGARREEAERVAWGELEAEPAKAFPDPVAGEEDLSCFDIPAAPDLITGYGVLNGVMRVSGAELLIRPDGAERGGTVRGATLLGFRDDLSDLLLPADALEDPETGDLVALSLPRSALPDGFLEPVTLPRHVRISRTPWGVRIRPTPGLVGLLRPRPARLLVTGALGLLLLGNLALLAAVTALLGGAPPAGP